ncbi:MAG: His/Gly/Thr/Pro-type tRNA ligase C-terminal domain-containing protein, partial [Planctomycetota bacterium]
NELLQTGIRAKTDLRNERLSQRIKDATGQKIPYMVIVGENEEKEKTIAIRARTKGDLGQQKLLDFIMQLKTEVKNTAEEGKNAVTG